MTSTDQPRKPGGSPEGGQFAGKEHADSGVELTSYSPWDQDLFLEVTQQRVDYAGNVFDMDDEYLDVTDIMRSATPEERRAYLEPLRYGEQLLDEALRRGDLLDGYYYASKIGWFAEDHPDIMDLPAEPVPDRADTLRTRTVNQFVSEMTDAELDEVLGHAIRERVSRAPKREPRPWPESLPSPTLTTHYDDSDHAAVDVDFGDRSVSASFDANGSVRYDWHGATGSDLSDEDRQAVEEFTEDARQQADGLFDASKRFILVEAEDEINNTISRTRNEQH